MNRALARPRISLSILHALLGLLLLALLPVVEAAGSPLPNDPGQILSLLEWPDGAAANGEACGDAVEDGDGDPDDVLTSGASGRLMDGLAGRKLPLNSPGTVPIAGLSGILRATGPPRAAL
jgi:hypothetical protein